MKPTTGRIVLYHPLPTAQDPQPKPQAAIVTDPKEELTNAADGPWVGLAVFRPNGTIFGLYPYSETPKPGYWTELT